MRAPMMQTTAHRVLANRICRLVILYRKRLAPTAWPQAKVEAADIAKLFQLHQKRIMHVAALGVEAFYVAHIPASAVGAFCYIATDAGHPGDSVETFIKSLCYGTDIDECDPRASFRRIVRVHAMRKEERHDHEILAFAIQTFNLHNIGALVEALLWNPENGMPRIARPKQ